jgi:hypothetical protein
LGYWRFEEGAGSTVQDSSGNGNTATLQNGASFAGDIPLSTVPRTGALNTNSLLLNGSQDYVSVPESSTLEPTNAITLEAWVKPTSSYGTAAIVGRQFGSATAANSYQIGLRPDLFFGLTNTQGQSQTIDTNIILPLNQWHHVAGTWDGSMLRLYLDGNQVGSAPFTGLIGYQASKPVLIGADEDGGSGLPDIGFLPGNIDEVRISNVALTPAQFLNAPASCTQFDVSLASAVTAGESSSMTVTAINELGETASGYRGTVHFTSSDPQAVLPADYTFTAADNGQHTFSLTLKTAGGQTISVTDTVNPVAYYRFEEGSGGDVIDSVDGLSEGTHNAAYSINVPANDIPKSGDADQFSLQFDGSTSASITSQPFIFHKDYTDATLEFWLNVPNEAHSSIFWTRGDATDANRFNIYISPGGIFGFDYREPNGTLHTLLPGDGTFAVPLNTWTHIGVTRTNSTYYFYRNGALIYEATDANPNLPDSTTWTIAGRGGYPFSGIVDEIRFVDRPLFYNQFLNSPPISGSASITVNSAAADHLIVAGYPSPTLVGQAGSFTVTAMDPYGNVATGFRDRVRFFCTDRSARLPRGYTFVEADNGSHTFQATFHHAGTQSLAAVDRDNFSIYGIQTGIVVQRRPRHLRWRDAAWTMAGELEDGTSVTPLVQETLTACDDSSSASTAASSAGLTQAIPDDLTLPDAGSEDSAGTQSDQSTFAWCPNDGPFQVSQTG